MVTRAVSTASLRQLRARGRAGTLTLDETPGGGKPLQYGDEQARQFRIFYSASDIAWLETAGRSRRSGAGPAADASSLSQVLRCAGGYLQQKCARLLRVVRLPDSLAVEYETSLGSRMKESFAVSDLYDLWVRMYLQRQARTVNR